MKEYRTTGVRMREIAEGDGPNEGAGHTRKDSPVVEGQRVEPIGGLSKGGTSFLPARRLEMDEALKPIRDPQALRNATPEEFAERAAKVLSELNYVHPFREGNRHASRLRCAVICASIAFNSGLWSCCGCLAACDCASCAGCSRVTREKSDQAVRVISASSANLSGGSLRSATTIA